MKILIVDDDDGIRELLVVTFENLFSECEILEATSGNQALKIMGSDPYFQMVVCDYDMQDGSGADVYRWMQENEMDFPFILHTSHPLKKCRGFENFAGEGANTLYLQKGLGFSDFKNSLTDFAPIAGSATLKRTDDDFKQVRIFYFYRYSKTLCDIYLKLSPRKYVKIINAGDRFEREVIDKYIQKKQDHLYIKNDDYNEFAGSLAKTPYLVFDDDMTQEDKITRTNAIVQSMALTTGISKSVIKLAEKNIDNVMEEAASMKTLAKLLGKLRNRLDYNYDHSYLLSYFCCIVCDKLGWSTRRSREKLCFAALFHDIFLEDPDLAIITDLDSPELEKFSEEKIELYKGHPEKAAQLVFELSNEYPNVDDIIRQHHERMDRSGFPRGLGHTQILPLSCVFILVHDFVSEMYRVDFEPSKYPEIIAMMKEKYTKGHFTKIMEAFEGIFTIG